MRSDDADADTIESESESESESAIFSQSKEEVHCLLVGGGDNCNIDNIDNDDNIDIEMGLSLEDLKKCWVELSELVEDEELLPEELEELFQKSLKDNGNHKLDKEGFYALYTSIDALFYMPEDDDEDDEESKPELEPEPEPSIVDLVQKSNDIKTKLMSKLNKMTMNAKNNKQLTCGFDCDDEQRKEIKDLIVDLSSIIPVSSSSNNHDMDDIPNLVTNNNNTNKNNKNTNKKKKLTTMQAMGEWKLLYTCSHAMLINRSLSGLGRSTSAKAQFLGLRKKMAGSRFLGTVEYIETFGGVVSDNGGDDNVSGDDDNVDDVNVDDDDDDDDDDVSFEVVVAGEWYFQQKNNEYTNLPAPCLTVELESVKYGPTTNGADQWSSLGPVKLTDFIYLDDDLMILRGNVNTNSLFVWKRIE